MENPNEKENPEREFEICIEYRLIRLAKVRTVNYSDSVDEDGCRSIGTNGIDWQKEYESEHMTPLETMEAVKEFMPFLTSHYLDEWRKENDKVKSAALWNKVNKIHDIWRSLEGWDEAFEEAYEV